MWLTPRFRAYSVTTSDGSGNTSATLTERFGDGLIAETLSALADRVFFDKDQEWLFSKSPIRLPWYSGMTESLDDTAIFMGEDFRDPSLTADTSPEEDEACATRAFVKGVLLSLCAAQQIFPPRYNAISWFHQMRNSTNTSDIDVFLSCLHQEFHQALAVLRCDEPWTPQMIQRAAWPLSQYGPSDVNSVCLSYPGDWVPCLIFLIFPGPQISQSPVHPSADDHP